MLGLTLSSSACVGLPKDRYVVSSIAIKGNDALDDDDILEKLATRESPRFLLFLPGVIYDYEVFDRFVLERDLERIERLYRANGYYRAKARAARLFYTGRSVVVFIYVEEGPPVRIRRIDLHGLDKLPERIARRVRRRVDATLKRGEPFTEAAYLDAEKRLRYELAEHGYAAATTRRAADLDLPRNSASVGFWVDPGERSRFGKARIVGLGALPEERVRRALDIREGDPYSQSDIDEAKRAILNLGVFSSVDIVRDPDAPASKDNRVPLLVRLEPSKLRTVRIGGGLTLDSLKTDVHLTTGWEDRNFFGGMRRFSVELQPGLVLYPTRLPDFQLPERLLPMARLRVDFREPGFIENRTNALVRTEFSIYPVLSTTEHDEDAPVIGYRELRLSFGVERSYWRTYAALTHNIQLNSPFTYIGQEDPDLSTVLVSYPELLAKLDLRDDPVKPRAGLYATNSLQVAGLGGDARDVKVQPEVRVYVPIWRRVSLAARSTIGLLFAQNYGETLEENALKGSPGEDVSRARWVEDIQLMFLRGFFSGGPGSNRGYAFREIGPHGTVPFYNPGQNSESTLERCMPDSETFSSAVCDLPLGGFTLWELNAELRFPISGPIAGALFADSSDVSPKRLSFRFNHPHLSVGFGLRYQTPIGPVRVDVGYRVPKLQAPKSSDEYTPGDIFGLPIAISFGIGESF